MKLSKIMEQRSSYDPFFPIPGMDPIPNQDEVVLSTVLYFRSKAEADERYPDGIQDYVRLHWAEYNPGCGWEVVVGWWKGDAVAGDGNPFIKGYPFQE